MGKKKTPDALVVEANSRGFLGAAFTDRYGVECHVRESSLASEDTIWLGCDKIGLKRFVPYQGWSDVPLEQEVGGVQHIANTSMLLTREMAEKLIPLLQRFVDTGRLGEDVEED